MAASYTTSSLPPLANLSTTSSQMDHREQQSRRPQLPSLTTSSFTRPSPPFSNLGPPQPQHHTQFQNTSTIPSVAFLTSATDSRKPYGDEKDTSASTRLSLPSISEALANGPSHNPTSSTTSHDSYTHASPRSSHFTWRSAAADGGQYSRPSPHDAPPARVPYMGSIAPATPKGLASQLPRGYTPKIEPADYPFRPSVQQSYTTSRQSPAPRSVPHWPAQAVDAYELPRTVDAKYAPYSYREYSPHPYNGSAPPPPPPAPSSMQAYSPVSHFPPPSGPQSGWRAEQAEALEYESSKKPRPYAESVKMHLDAFDLEAAWHEIASSSHQVLDIAQHYQQQAHQSQKPGASPGATASITELDTIIRNASVTVESASRMREIAISQEAALAERSQQLNQGVKHALTDDSQDTSRDSGYGGPDAKKRRGRAAPPGRCHSCNRAETPEWRRGPDGARTLCNACGLHYAKLTRKLGANKQPLQT